VEIIHKREINLNEEDKILIDSITSLQLNLCERGNRDHETHT